MFKKYKIIYSEVSKNDLLEIVLFYKNIDIDLALKFKSEVLDLESFLKLTPEIYNVRYDDIRRVNFSIFPFCMFFQIMKNEVRILRVLHKSRDPMSFPVG